MKLELDERDKKMLVYGGIIAAGISLVFYIMSRQQVAANGGSVSDIQNTVASNPTPIYTNYNMGNTFSATLGGAADESPAGSQDQCGCAGAGNCFGNGSNLYNGQNTYPGSNADFITQAYLNYLQNTNPNYVALYAEQMQLYSALFATGETYGSAPGQAIRALGITQQQLGG